MTVAVVTSCSAQGWDEYGRRFVESFKEFWPADIALYVVSEDTLPMMAGVRMVHLCCSDPAMRFLARHDTPRAKGRERRPNDAGWTPKKIADGYNFRYDAHRFAKKVFAIDLIARRFVTKGPFYWVDADVVTFAKVEHDLLTRLLPSDKALSCLDRGQYHSECGFVGYNLDHPQTAPFIEAFADLYASDEVFGLQEWHDSWVFDWLRRKTQIVTHAIPHKSRSHPFVNSELGAFADHRKGARKLSGTPRRELVINQELPYWREQCA